MRAWCCVCVCVLVCMYGDCAIRLLIIIFSWSNDRFDELGAIFCFRSEFLILIQRKWANLFSKHDEYFYKLKFVIFFFLVAELKRFHEANTAYVASKTIDLLSNWTYWLIANAEKIRNRNEIDKFSRHLSKTKQNSPSKLEAKFIIKRTKCF